MMTLTKRWLLVTLLALLLPVLSACDIPFIPLINEQPQGAVYLVRHAQAHKNLPAELQTNLSPEQLDSLTDLGREQAHALAQHLRNADIQAVLTSPAGRTAQTASILARELDLPRTHNAPALAQLAPDEPMAQGVQRAHRLIRDWTTRTPDAHLVLVTHGDIIAGLLASIAQTPKDLTWQHHDVPGGSVTTLKGFPDHPRILQQGYTPSPG